MAEVYELDKPVSGQYDDVAYYLERFQQLGNGARILELACGTGRFVIPMRIAGLDFDGLDHSEYMLESCQSQCRERALEPRLYHARMSSFTVPTPYSAILIGSGSVRELDGPEQLSETLRCSRAALEPDGLLFLDAVPPRSVSGAVSSDSPTTPAPPRMWSSGDHRWSLQTVRLSYNSAKNRSVQTVKYEKYIGGTLEVSEIHDFVVQHWTLWELKEMLRSCRFEVLDVFANYTDGLDPGANDEDWTLVARRS